MVIVVVVVVVVTAAIAIVVVLVVVVTAAIAIVVVLYNRDKLLFQGSRLEKGNKLTICYLADVNNICDFVHLFTYDDQGFFSII